MYFFVFTIALDRFHVSRIDEWIQQTFSLRNQQIPSELQKSISQESYNVKNSS